MPGIGFIHMCDRGGMGDMSACVLYICYEGKRDASWERKTENVCLTGYVFPLSHFHPIVLCAF